ncbi:MAG: DUF6090 family protein, partial [Flavobacteriaceae bacterium]|nr:DUF6090 family protein [Flavobacteriaceae bacterium]
NAFKKYLIYAILEIFLVMIGILLAFQVSDWDTNHKERMDELTTYTNIRDQINNDRDRIEGQISFNNRFLSMFQHGTDIIEKKDFSQKDTLGKIAFNLTNYSDFDRKGNIYETLINSGQIKLLKNHQIVLQVKELEEHYLYINRIENIHYDGIMKHAIPGISKTVNFSSGEIMDMDGIYSYEFQNLIYSLIYIMDEKDQSYKTALVKIDKTIELIDKELSNR